MRWALEIRSWELQGRKAQLPSLWGAAPVRPCSHCRHGYTAYMQRILDRHPFLSIVDLSLVGEGWKDGWECSSRNAGTSHGQLQINRCSFCNSVGGNSMPPVVVQQPTKCDPSSPLHRGSNAQTRMHTAKIVVSEMQGDSGFQMRQFLTYSERRASCGMPRNEGNGFCRR
jgi:hypothetical protein